jgi:predicted RNA-binding protein YlxR (DUF448 family)
MTPRAEPQRTCTGCGEKKNKDEMVRIVISPDGKVVPDLKGRLPARGAYVCPDGSCIERAASGRLRHSLKAPASVKLSARELVDKVSGQYEVRALSLLGLAQKSGSLVSGTNLVEAEVRRGKTEGQAGVIASDASPDVTAAARKTMEKKGIPVADFATRETLGDAIGKSPRSVILVKDTGIAAEFLKTLGRYRSVGDKGGLDT